MERLVATSLSQSRLSALLLAIFGAVALILAAVGVYGVMSYAVTERVREIGVRMALGAERRRIVTLILNAMRRPVMIGVLIGLPAAWAATRSVQSMLFGLQPGNPLAIGAAIAVLTVVAHAAAYLPARRAARVDPVGALRSE
jgi:ABC-type antimicrobial peptide transport system permease subunit